MRKTLLLCISAIIVFSLAACGNPTTPVTFSIPDDVTEASVTHVFSGQVSEWSISRNDLLLLTEWVSGLQCEQKDFEPGKTPGDTEGGEGYSFAFNGKPDLDFSYVINGENDCYLLFGSTWYSVSNPVDPPLSNSISELP